VATPPLVELRDATVVLGGARALDRLTLTIPVGQHTAILGPNGAGKSTLVKLLTLQQYPLAADDPPIRVFGRERWDVFALRSQLGIVSADLHDRFVQGNANGVVTAIDAVTSGFFASHGIFAHQRVTVAMRDAGRDALARMGVEHLAATPLATMSTGEARRVLIARALVHNPSALVLDEPTRGLDLVARHRFMERVRAIAREGTTILLVTHYVDEIIPEIDRVVLLKGGRVAFDASKAEALQAARLSEAFEADVAVERVDGYYFARPLR
jgi:iron complex transport system ATP-binding protein